MNLEKTSDSSYLNYSNYIMTETQLDRHKYPTRLDSNSMVPDFTTKCLINKVQQDPSVLTKQCIRCSSTFSLAANDLTYLSSNTKCVHHKGKLRCLSNSFSRTYSCCNGGPGKTGCSVTKHVYRAEYGVSGAELNMTGYVETAEPTDKNRKTDENIYAVDCEMCYTVRGFEATRVTVVDIHCKVVYESLINPNSEILDYNTEFSGLTEEMLQSCTKSLKDVQADLLRLFDKDTILVGHSLEHDLKALKLVHKKVADTSVVFPHKLGLPNKRALRYLVKEKLNKVIQTDGCGHDSNVDASSCIELMTWKIRNDKKIGCSWNQRNYGFRYE